MVGQLDQRLPIVIEGAEADSLPEPDTLEAVYCYFGAEEACANVEGRPPTLLRDCWKRMIRSLSKIANASPLWMTSTVAAGNLPDDRPELRNNFQ